jgi:hypothetical protein
MTFHCRAVLLSGRLPRADRHREFLVRITVSIGLASIPANQSAKANKSSNIVPKLRTSMGHMLAV